MQTILVIFYVANTCLSSKNECSTFCSIKLEVFFQFRITELSSPETRETALLELSKKREVVPDLAPMLWHSFGKNGLHFHDFNKI